MADDGNTAAIWFDKGLLFHKLRPTDVVSRKALQAAFKCYGLGLGFFVGILSLVFALRTGAKLEMGEFVGLSGFCLIPIVNTAVFVALFYVALRLSKIRVSLRVVTTVCCCAYGGLLPLVSIATAYFLYSAIQLAATNQNPAIPYLTVAIKQGLLAQSQVPSVRVLVWLSVILVFASTAFYFGNMIKLLSKTADKSKVWRVTVGALVAWCLNVLAIRAWFRLLFWFVIIKAAIHHAQVVP